MISTGQSTTLANICASSSSDVTFIERRNTDVTERQAHDSQLVRVQPGETSGSPVAALPASGEISASKRRKTVLERGRATGRSAASSEACSVVSKTLAGRGQEEAEPVDIWRRPWTGPLEPGAGAQESSGVGSVERSEGCRGNWREPRWPQHFGLGSMPAYNRCGKGRAATRQSEGVVVAMPTGTTQPVGAKDPYFIDADAGREGSVSA